MSAIRPCDLRVLIIGAHPDDPDLTAGGLALKYVKAGAAVKLVSMCNGDKGHMTMSPEALAARRYQEAQRSKEILGVYYGHDWWCHTWLYGFICNGLALYGWLFKHWSFSVVYVNNIR